MAMREQQLQQRLAAGDAAPDAEEVAPVFMLAGAGEWSEATIGSVPSAR